MRNQAPPTIEEVKRKALPILERWGARRAGVFGSLARGEMRRQSDIDLLVDVPEALSLLDIVRLKHELEDALGRKVDVVEYSAIRPLIRDRVLADEVPIL